MASAAREASSIALISTGVERTANDIPNTPKEGSPAEEEEDAESRTRRRLAQNREAARKSRQRRKQYVARLEAEVRLPGRFGKSSCIFPLLSLRHAKPPMTNVWEGTSSGHQCMCTCAAGSMLHGV